MLKKSIRRSKIDLELHNIVKEYFTSIKSDK